MSIFRKGWTMPAETGEDRETATTPPAARPALFDGRADCCAARPLVVLAHRTRTLELQLCGHHADRYDLESRGWIAAADRRQELRDCEAGLSGVQ